MNLSADTRHSKREAAAERHFEGVRILNLKHCICSRTSLLPVSSKYEECNDCKGKRLALVGKEPKKAAK